MNRYVVRRQDVSPVWKVAWQIRDDWNNSELTIRQIATKYNTEVGIISKIATASETHVHAMIDAAHRHG